MASMEERLEGLFCAAIEEDRAAEESADPQTLGERCRKYAAKLLPLLLAGEAMRQLSSNIKWDSGEPEAKWDAAKAKLDSEPAKEKK